VQPTDLPPFAYAPLTPVTFLRRSAAVFPDRVAVVDGNLQLSYAELAERSARWAGALRARGLARGDRVAVLAPNSHLLLEAHTGPAQAGVVLVALNTRLAVAEVATILDASGARLLVAHADLLAAARDAAERTAADIEVVAALDWEDELAAAEPLDEPVTDELSLLSLNYTSGTTGQPKGVQYHHRGAYLQALAMVVHARLDARSSYLWTLPMFHCNGWAFTWAVTAAGGTHVCLPAIDPPEAWRLVRDEGVTHFCAAPTVLTMLASSPAAAQVDTGVRAFTGGAPPTPALLEELDGLGVEVVHLYGLTESFGPSVICEWHPEWDELPPRERAEVTARQGVGNVLGGGVRVVDPTTGDDVARDEETLGEIVLRGNTLMAGYLDDPDATAAATTPDGWFRTGDLAVVHADGYVEIRDRAKDIIVSGGENISSVEVERVLARHPAVLEAAVVGVPHERWGERPRAHVVLRDGANASAEELRAHVREHLAGFKVPDEVVFGELPRTSTGKIQKHVLRDR